MGILSSLHDEQEIKMYSVFRCHWSIPSISNRKHFKAKKKKPRTWEIQIRMILSWNKKPLNPNQKKMDTLLFCFFFFLNKNDENILA